MTIEHIVDAGHVVIEPLHDPLQQLHWLPAASNDLLAYITPILGPTATLIMHRYAHYFAAGHDHHQLGLDELGATFGIRGRNNVLVRSLSRIDRFGFGRLAPNTPTLRIRTAIPPLAQRVAQRIPAHLADTCPYIIR